MVKWADKVGKVVFVETLGETPAAVHRATGTILVNRHVWNSLDPDARFFLLLHEAGHIVLKSSDEKLVDAWAHREYLKRGKSITQSILALTRLLSYNNPEHLERTANQWNRAVHHDRHVKNNPKAFNLNYL